MNIKEKLKQIFFKDNKRNDNIKKQSTIPEKESISIIFKDDMTIIDIQEECSLEDYCKYTEEVESIPLYMIYATDKNILKSNLEKQKIYIIKTEKAKYFITSSDNKIQISERTEIEDEFHEGVIKITESSTNEYTISKYVHDLNYSTKMLKWYPAKNHNMFVLEKKEAFEIARNILTNLKQIKNIKQIININDLYTKLNIFPDEYYHPIISDDVITLSKLTKTDDINKEEYVNFYIILNETREKLGDISFNYQCNSGFTYGGNVGYNIDSRYQNNHYATRALTLLKQLLVNNEHKGDKDLYIATIPDNIKSQHVILNNDGKLIYEGEVPEDSSLNYIDGIKNVKVYQIKI